MPTTDRTRSWTSAWLDVLAFGLGLVAAWAGAWTTTDLVWSLWLSSLVVGYAMIVWQIARPGVAIALGAWSDGPQVRQAVAQHGVGAGVFGGSILLVFGLFMLAFFTVHFGGFHFVHSQFLAMFFPVDASGTREMAGLATYTEVARRYWTFLPAAFLAERAGFTMLGTRRASGRTEAGGTTAAPSISRMGSMQPNMMAPYRNVVRMHLLIFFFAFAAMAKLDNFAVYAVVYAVYFFPWRLVRRRGRQVVAATTA